MGTKKALTAIIWDYDGTLVNTRVKNYHVARAVQEAVTGRSADEFEVLRSFEAYDEADRQATNWRDLCRGPLGLSEEQTDHNGRLWTQYQLMDQSPTPLFDGIPEVLAALDKAAQGIVSMNGRAQILSVLEEKGLSGYFRCVVGHEEVSYQRQKPAPDGFLHCLEGLTGFGPGRAYYIGDHETDVRVAQNADKVLSENGHPVKVFSIGAFYGSHGDRSRWAVQPDFAAYRPEDILSIVGN